MERLFVPFLKVRLVQLIVRTIEGMAHHDVTDRAAAVAYYALLSILPLILGVIAILGLFLPSAAVKEALHAFFHQNIPAYASFLENNIENIIKMRGTFGILSALGLLWTGSALFSSLNRAINRSCGISVGKSAPFHKRKLWELSMSLGIIIVFIFSWGVSLLVSILPEGLSGMLSLNVLTGFLSFILLFLVLSLIYKFIPNCKMHWRFIWPGALLAAVLLEGLQVLFSVYITSFASFELIYGSITAIVIVLLWVYFSALAVILGAEFITQYSLMKLNPGGEEKLNTKGPR
jgi:membrane protein